MTGISSLGEFGLIKKLTAGLRNDASVVKGVGDDCAVLKLDRRQYILYCSDMIVEGVDFTLSAPPQLIGRKALAINLSDIAACAGVPRYCLVSLGLPRSCSVSFAEKLYSGLRALAAEFKVNIVGGDISRADKLAIDVSMIGVVEKEKLVLRSGARPGDLIFVSGSLGNSIAGKHLRFVPRVKEARLLAARYRPHAMIDISDGLAADLGHLCEASAVGARLFSCCIPCVKGLAGALHDGEDFELLFALPPARARKLAVSDRRFRAIGQILPRSAGMRLVDNDGRETVLKAQGFRHF